MNVQSIASGMHTEGKQDGWIWFGAALVGQNGGAQALPPKASIHCPLLRLRGPSDAPLSWIPIHQNTLRTPQ